ncbi:MAG TPA: tripartite tricarboxylate transporter substrate binding protein [Burkholderiales bacterium]|nr:tripartite tricarboxylate transporter substrate binding protein [Burkholderiales bacterium]
MKTMLLCVAAVLVTAVAPPAISQKYPTKPIRLIVPFPPGGGTDIMSRAISAPVSQSLGQSVVCDNRPGAGSAIGSELAVRAEPDGYTIIMISSSYAANAAYRKLPYDPVKDIQPIILVGTTGLVMTVHPSVPVKNVPELIALAKSQPGKLNYASVGAGSVTQLMHELFKILTKTDIVHVPFKGGGPALTALVGGQIQMSAISLVPTLPHVKAGRLRAIGISTPKRSPLLPDVQAIGETVPGFEVIHWYGLWGPKGLPRNIVTLWNKEVAKVLLTDEMKRRTQAEGLDLGAGPPEQFHTVIRRDVEKWRRVVKEANIERAG